MTTSGAIDADHAEALPAHVRVAGVRSSDAETVSETFEDDDASRASRFDFETLGPLSGADHAEAVRQLRSTMHDLERETLQLRIAAENATGNGLREYGDWLNSRRRVMSWKAAHAGFLRGDYFTMPRPNPVSPGFRFPDGHTGVAFTMKRGDEERILVGAFFDLSEHPECIELVESVEQVRTAQAQEFATVFNAQPESVRKARIAAHDRARLQLRGGAATGLTVEELEQLQEALLPAGIEIDRSSWCVASGR